MRNIEELIDKLHLEDLQNESHPSIFDENEEYSMLIIRLPVITDALQVQSIGFVLTAQNSYAYNKDKKIFEELTGAFEGPYAIIDKFTDRVLKSFITYQDEIADMEELLYKDNFRNDFMKNWLALKVDILRIERILLRAEITLKSFIDSFSENPEFPINKYIDIHEHIERTMRSATLQLSKLDYLYNFYNAKSNDKMNRMIYFLTIISAIFLPLNLLVGFFGMNTSGLPFTQGSAGTYYVISVMLLLFGAVSIVTMNWRKKVEK